MAQVYQPLCPELTNVIRQEFLPVAFSNAANVLGSCDYPLAVDGTIYLTLIAFVLSRHGELRTAIDSALFSNAESLWATIGGPRLNFSEFAKRYPSSGSRELLNSIQYRTPKPAQLLEFSNPLFDPCSKCQVKPLNPIRQNRACTSSQGLYCPINTIGIIRNPSYLVIKVDLNQNLKIHAPGFGDCDLINDLWLLCRFKRRL